MGQADNGWQMPQQPMMVGYAVRHGLLQTSIAVVELLLNLVDHGAAISDFPTLLTSHVMFQERAMAKITPVRLVF